jgi:hypothetical protein
LGDVFVRENEQWRRALILPRTLDNMGGGNLCRLRDKGVYGRELAIATSLPTDELSLAKWVRKLTGDKVVTRATFEKKIIPPLAELVSPGTILETVTRGTTVSLRIDYSEMPAEANIDSLGRALKAPPERENLPAVCRECDQLEFDRTVAITNSPAFAWRQLGLVEPDGRPTSRGVIFSFFQAGEGLAVAAAVHDETYPIDDLVFDLANIRAGPRFAGEDAPLGGRLGTLCQRIYKRLDYPGYLAMGVPVQYGAGAAEVVKELIASPGSRYKLTSELLRHGDIERALTEWRSLLRHIVAAPDFELTRWRQLKQAAANFADRTTSPALMDLPPLLASQQRR